MRTMEDSGRVEKLLRDELQSLAAGKNHSHHKASANPRDLNTTVNRPNDLLRREAEDDRWKCEHLRANGGQLVLDLANVLRIIELHPDFSNRFLYARSMGKVLDRGTVLLDWQIYALAAEIQERFLPGVSENLVLKGLTVAANRAREAREAFL